MPSSIVSCHGLSKRFSNGTVALGDVTLDISEHQFLSLLGPSGCGKSTLLRLIAGLAEPTSGSIDWQAKETGGLSFVFQEPTLMPWGTALANVELPLKLAGVPAAERLKRAGAVLGQVGLGDFANAYHRELSGGMKMRVSIARALVTRPALLLMDEPFAALDEITRLKLNDDLVAIKVSLGATVVFVTHSVYESVYLSSRIVVMAARPGRIVAEIAVDAPLPRDEEFRLGKFYADRCRETSLALHGAMEAKP